MPLQELDPSIYKEVASNAPATGAPSASAVGTPPPASTSAITPQAASPATATPPAVTPQPSATQPSTSQPSATQPSATQPASPQPSANNSGLQELDPNQFKELPAYASGLSPDAPINKSPVSLLDRAKLALGNQKGNIEYLKQHFQDAKTDGDGHLVVQQGGNWYRVSAKGLGDPDPWQASKATSDTIKDKAKEVLGGIVDQAPDAVKGATMGAIMGAPLGPVGIAGGAAIGAAAPYVMHALQDPIQNMIANHPAALGALAATSAVKGISKAALKATVAPTIADGVLEGIRTSLGRLEGTYDATPQEQLSDIGTEMLYNVGGQLVITGAKPTASWLADKVASVGKGLSTMAPTSRQDFAGIIAKAMNKDPEDFIRLSERPQGMQRSFAGAVAVKGDDTQGIKDYLDLQNNQKVKQFVAMTRQALNSHYEALRQQALQAVPETYSGDTSDVVHDAWKAATKAGLGEIAAPGPTQYDAGRLAPLTAEQLEKDLPQGASFQFHTPDVIQQKATELMNAGKINEASNLLQVSASQKDMGYLRQAMAAVEQHGTALSGDSSGKAAANKMLTLKKLLGGTLSGIDDAAYKDQAMAARPYIKSLTATLDNSFLKSFDERLPDGTIRNPFAVLNKSYNDVSNQVQPLLKTQNQSFGAAGDDVYNTLRRQVLSSGAKSATRQSAFDESVRTLSQYNPELRTTYNTILDNDAAKSLTPETKGLGNVKSLLSRASTAVAKHGALAVSSGTNLAQSYGGGLANTVKPIADAGPVKVLVDSGFKGLDMTRNMVKSGQMGEFLKNPNAVNLFMKTLVSGPQIHQAVSDHLNQQLQGAAAPIAMPQQLPGAK